jgi:hypothetical protein
VYSVLAGNIVLMARVREIIDLNVILDTFSYEAEAVLPYDYRIDSTLTDQELALEILRLVDEAGLCVSFRIGCRIVHITLSIHYLIPFPVDYRTSGYSDLEYVRIVCDE